MGNNHPTVPDLNTNWHLAHENDYYDYIILEEIQEVWSNTQPLVPPLIVKAIIATESNFNKDATNGNFCGLMQTPCSYDYSKIHAGTWRDPRTAIHVGLIYLREKMNRIKDSNFLSINALGESLTTPTARAELWKYAIDAYNGGQGTMRNSMAYAKQMGKDYHIWQNIVEPQNKPKESPLYKAILLNKWKNPMSKIY